MAVPTLTANSPVAGKVAWSAFTISYGGQVYPISAGNTAFKYVYWIYSTATPGVAQALASADTLPALTDDDLVLFVNRGGIPVNVQSANVVDGSIIASGSIIGDAIAANTIDAGKLKADTITAREIGAGAVTTSELSISALGDGLVANGEFEDYDPATFLPTSWDRGFEVSGSAATLGIETAAPISGSTSLKVTVAANTGEALACRPFAVVPGKKLSVAAAFKSSVAGTGLFYIRVLFGTTPNFTRAQAVAATPTLVRADVYNGATGATASPPTATAAGYADVVSGWAPPTTDPFIAIGQVVVPANAKFCRVVLYTWASASAYVGTWDAVDARLTVTSTYIGDGEISTRNVAAGSITTDRLAAGAITADCIAAGAIDGKTITGALIQSALNLASGTGPAGVRIPGSTSADRIEFFSGKSAETSPGAISTGWRTWGSLGQQGYILLTPQDFSGGGLTNSYIRLGGGGTNGTAASSIDLVSGGQTSLQAGSTLYLQGVDMRLTVTNDVTLNGSSMPRGIVARGNNTNSVPLSTTVAAETTLVTAPSFTYKAGRTYRISLSCYFTAGAAGALIRVYVKNGATNLTWAQRYYAVAGGPGGQSMSYVDWWTPATDVTVALAMTATATAGANPASSSLGGKTVLIVEDMGV